MLAVVPAAVAQAPTPGDIQAPFRDRPQPPPGVLPAGVAPAPEVRPVVPPGGRTVRVERFELSGNDFIPDDELQAILKAWRGKELTLLEIYDAADAITRRYREQGYALASATVPAQKVADGVVRIEVVEGRVGGLRFTGNRRYDDDFLDYHVDEIGVGQRLRLDALERELLLLNDMPGLQVRSIIEPGEEYGTSNIVIETQETPVAGRIGLNNYGRESAGEWRLEGSLDVNNPLGMGDALGLQLVHSEAALLDFYAGLNYSLPVNNKGTRAGISLARYVYEVDERDVEQFRQNRRLGLITSDVGGDGSSVRLQVTHPLERSRARNTLVGAGFNRSDTTSTSRATLVGGPSTRTTSEQHIAFLDASILTSWRHDDGSSTIASAVVSSNFEKNDDGTETNAHRGKLDLEASHLRRIGDGWSLYARARAALSIDPLANTERFRIGGPADVRGFPSAELAGDYGAQLTLEGRRYFQLTQELPAQWRVYWDGGILFRKDGAADVKAGADERDSLTSLGTGISVSLPYRATATLDLVIPTHGHEPSDDRDDARVWASVGKQF